MRLWALRFQPFVTFDGTEYIRFAESLLAGKAFVSVFPPGYPVLVALARLIVADRLGAAVAVSILCGVTLPLVVWLLARRAVGERWALCAALAVALHPELSRFSALSMTESAYLIALYLGLLLVATGRPLPSGLAVGAAYAIRPEALLVAGALGVGGVRGAFLDRRGRIALLAGALGFVLIAVPCWIYFHHTQGVWTLTPKVSTLHAPTQDWRAAEPHAGVAPEAGADRFDPIRRARAHGAEMLRDAPANALKHGRALLMLWPWPLLLLSLWGLAVRRGIESLALLVLPALPLLGLAAHPRFALAAIPALTILAVVPLTRRHRIGRALAVVLWSGGAIACAWAHMESFVMAFDGSLVTERRAGQWLEGVAEPEAVVMDRKPFVAFYARRTHRIIPDDPYDAIVAGAVRDRVRYLVVPEWMARQMRPQLLPLLVDASFRQREPRLEMIYAGADARGSSLAMFRVLQPGEMKLGALPVVDSRGYVRGESRGP
jgi:hypothetical protein